MNENPLTWYSDEELRKELQRRERLAKEASKPPKQLWKEDGSDIDLIPLRKICKDYIDGFADGNHPDGDIEHYIMECAVETIYGPGIWDWVNERIG